MCGTQVEPPNQQAGHKLSKYQESFGIRSQWDGSLATAQTCEFAYGDSVSGKIEIQSATSSWGVGYLKLATKRGASCAVAANIGGDGILHARGARRAASIHSTPARRSDG